MKKLIGELEPIPRFYGVAYRSFSFCGRSVCYPIPINWLVRWGIDLMTRLRIPAIERWHETEMHAAYADGFRRGRRDAEAAYERGYDAGVNGDREGNDDSMYTRGYGVGARQRRLLNAAARLESKLK